MKYKEKGSMSMTQMVVLGLASVFTIATLLSLGQLFENLDAKQLMVIQSPIDGTLAVYTEPGVKWQWFGKVTTYPRREQFSFSQKSDQGKQIDESISTRFNDGGHGNVSGVVSWEMPLKIEDILRLHKEFGSFHAIEQQMIRPMIEKVVYNIGPTMSSTESSAEKRPEIPQYMDDQLQNGPYLTETKAVVQKDPITGADKNVNIVSIVKGSDGMPKRTAPSQLKEYGIKMFPVTINNIKYDQVVEKQIAERQQATTQVQIAIANSMKAQQDAKTIEAQGQATAAKAKWEQETIKAKFVTEAQQKLEVATLGAKEAEQYKREQILRGEGDAQRKQLVMSADGALDQKLEALKEINGYYADAIAKASPGAWTPAVVMGSGAGGSTNGAGASALIDMFTAKTARDLGIDMAVGGKGATAKK
jgi:hypothetical protein